jgi:hypothetical protein
VFGASRMLGVEESNEAKSHAPNNSSNAILLNLLMLTETLKGKLQLKVINVYEFK